MYLKGNIVDIFSDSIYAVRMHVDKGIIVSIERIDEELQSYFLPGFIDAHVHIESSMLVPSEFAAAAVKHGTVAVVSDPHEIANVLGVEGVNFMINNSNTVPMRFYFGAPSCVPATPLESSGANLGPDDIELLLGRSDIYFLSEMMNYPGVIFEDPDVMAKIASAKRMNKKVDGHAPGLVGEELDKYINAGISTDHEASTIEEGIEKIRKGMSILIREGSAARNLEALAPLYNSFPDKLMLCCDDIHPEMLEKRHINGPVRDLIGKNYNLYDVLRSASLNPVKHYNLDVGLLRKGDRADFIIVEDLVNFDLQETWIGGECVYKNGEVMFSTPAASRPNRFNSSSISVDMIAVENEKRAVKVINVEDGELLTTESREFWSDKDHLDSSIEKDILKLVVKDRYNDKPPSVGFIKGFGISSGAIASSVAHDSHNIIAVGANDESIVSAINAVIESKGGLVVADNGLIDQVKLPVAGIMSDVPCGTIAKKYLNLSEKVSVMGCHLKAPFMTLSFMALLVIPELKLGDRGLFDGRIFDFTSLFAD